MPVLNEFEEFTIYMLEDLRPESTARHIAGVGLAGIANADLTQTAIFLDGATGIVSTKPRRTLFKKERNSVVTSTISLFSSASFLAPSKFFVEDTLIILDDSIATLSTWLSHIQKIDDKVRADNQVSINWQAMTALEKRQVFYPSVENVFKATNIIGFYKTETAMRHLFDSMPVSHLSRIHGLVRAMDVPPEIIDIMVQSLNRVSDFAAIVTARNTSRTSAQLVLDEEYSESEADLLPFALQFPKLFMSTVSDPLACPPKVPRTLWNDALEAMACGLSASVPSSKKMTLDIVADQIGIVCQLREYTPFLVHNQHLRKEMYALRNRYELLQGPNKVQWHQQLGEMSAFVKELNALRDAALKAKSAKTQHERTEKELALAKAKEVALQDELASKNAKKHRTKRAKNTASQATTTRMDTDGESDGEGQGDDDPMDGKTDSAAAVSVIVVDDDDVEEIQTVGIKNVPKTTDEAIATVRPSTIRIPYVVVRGVDVSHPSYLKCMNLIAKSNPLEVLQVDKFIASTKLPKRRRGAKRLTFNDAYYSSQANDTRSVSEIMTDAGRACRVEQRVSNDALLRKEIATRDQLHVTSHTLSYSLRLFEFIKAEHDIILKEIAARQLTVIEDPHV
ncbi:hypothetical protein B0H11DRAFT_2262028 [Mycena galericulata]|nr:hypothetical protein B0H11DRAFT_2262028 [Mycena galericulata]